MITSHMFVGAVSERQILCQRCRNSYAESEMFETDGRYYCSSCQADLPHCEDCGGRFDPNFADSSWIELCSSCSDNNFECEACGERCHNRYYGGEGLCVDCLQDEDEDEYDSNLIHNYHCDMDFIFHSRPQETTKLFFGVELETSHYPSLDSASEALHALNPREDLFYMTDDASLFNGIEIISHPMTLQFHREEMIWRNIVQTVSAKGGRSHDTEDCGLHVHFSKNFFWGKKSDLYQMRLVYICEKFWGELTNFARRESGFALKWNKSLTDTAAKHKVLEMRHAGHGHYSAVNLTHPGTIEIRLFKGTLKYETLMATIELVDFLARAARYTATKVLQKVTWAEFVKGIDNKGYDYLPAYLKQCNLHPSQNPPDTGWREPAPPRKPKFKRGALVIVTKPFWFGLQNFEGLIGRIISYDCILGDKVLYLLDSKDSFSFPEDFLKLVKEV